MKTTGLPNAVNDVQKEFLALCEKGGGQKGGPSRGKVLELLNSAGKSLNKLGFAEAMQALADNPDANPWHVCFAVGLAWGHLARLEPEFISAAVAVLECYNAADLKIACQFHNERGPLPIEQSLSGGYSLFQRVTLPEKLPDSLERMGRAQERWFAPITGPNRPRYIGSWNATAMFMTALFAQPALAAQLMTPEVRLPPNGPVYRALSLLHKTHILAEPPAGTELDDEAFEPGAIYENNHLFEEIRRGLAGWSLVDVHSGLYMLGTRYVGSNSIFDKV